MTALELRAVTKRYGRTTAVDDVTLSVSDGELVALVGPSGCGKSTLLMLAAGLLEPDAGQVLVDGRLVAGGGRWVPPEERRVGVVFQDAALFPHLRVADNIAFGLSRGRDRADRVQELLELVDLPGHGRRYPHELSGGQQQRVALARALAPRPSVVLFDEAFGNLDHALRRRCATRRPPPCAAPGAAGVFVTHDQSEALAVGERVCVMREGRFEHVGEPADAFHRPATRFVATLLGEADFVPGHQSGGVVATEVGKLEATPGGVRRRRGHAAAARGRLHPRRRRHRAGRPAGVPRRDLRLPAAPGLRRVPALGAAAHRRRALGTAVRPVVVAGHPVRTFPADG
jgi:iron(III) transport system ATP-binding protein